MWQLYVTVETDLSNDREMNRHLLCFFGYKTESFSFQNNPKDLDPSGNLDLWDCLERVGWLF